MQKAGFLTFSQISFNYQQISSNTHLISSSDKLLSEFFPMSWVGAVKYVKPPVIYHRPFQGGSSVVILCHLFLVSISMMFRHAFVMVVFSLVWVAGWPPFWKELLTWSDVCSLYTLTICNFSYLNLENRGQFMVAILL